MEEDIYAVLKKNPEKKIVIFGVGAGGRVVFQECMKNALPVAYFVDNGKKGTFFETIEVKDPLDLMYEEENSLCILISACRDSLCREIAGELEGMGFIAGKDFFIPRTGRIYAPLDLFDPFLGYSRKEEILDGFRITEGLTENAPKIVVLGGSTSDPTFGNISSWVEVFAEKLKKNGYDFAVYNGALAGYCVNQELLKFLRDVLPLSPSLVITMDGFNDAAQPRVEENPFYHPFLAENLKKMFENTEKEKMDINGGIKAMHLGAKEKISRSRFYLRLLASLHGAAAANGIDHISFLQPNSSLEKDSSFAPLKVVTDFYKEVLERKPSYMVDASRILEKISDCYMDYAHYSKKGNEIIAGFVLEKVEEFLKKQGEKDQ